jgi:predicted RNA binding protein YcfA (HicA-like mRNA interferase family)
MRSQVSLDIIYLYLPPSLHEEEPEDARQEFRWVKIPSEERYYASRTIRLSNSQQRVLESIRNQEKFSFTMDRFVNLMEGLGITQQSRKGSHVHFDTPGGLPKIFVNPHGWTNRFGLGAMRDMRHLIDGSSLSQG